MVPTHFAIIAFYAIFHSIQFCGASNYSNPNAIANSTEYYSSTLHSPTTTSNLYTTVEAEEPLPFWTNFSHYEIHGWNVLFISICTFALFITFCGVATYLCVRQKIYNAKRKKWLLAVNSTKRSSVCNYLSTDGRRISKSINNYSNAKIFYPDSHLNILHSVLGPKGRKAKETMQSNSNTDDSGTCHSSTVDEELGVHGFLGTTPSHDLPSPDSERVLMI